MFKNTYALKIENFNAFLHNTDKKSINEKDTINYGGILIKKAKKKVHYTYDILGLLSKIRESEMIV